MATMGSGIKKMFKGIFRVKYFNCMDSICGLLFTDGWQGFSHHSLSFSLHVLNFAVLRICALFMSLSSINFQIILTTLGLCPRVTCTQTHTCIIHSEPVEKRGRISYLQIYALHISHDQCVCIYLRKYELEGSINTSQL